MKTGLVASCSSGSPTLRPSLPPCAVTDAAPPLSSSAEATASPPAAAGILENAEGAAEKALKAEGPGAFFVAAAKPLVEAKEEKGEADARFVVGAALVKGVEELALEDAAGAWLGGVGTAARGTLDAEKVDAEKLDLAFGFCASASGLAVAMDPRGDTFVEKAEKGDEVDE